MENNSQNKSAFRIFLGSSSFKIIFFGLIILVILFWLITKFQKDEQGEEKIIDNLRNGCEVGEPGCLDIVGTAREYGISLYQNEERVETDWTNPKNNFTQESASTILETDLILQTNNITDEKLRKEVLDQLTEEYKNRLFEKKYLDLDIKINQNPNPDYLKKYYDEIFSEILYYKEQIQNITYSKNRDPDFRKEEIISLNDNLSASILNISATIETAKIHLDILNTLYFINVFLISSQTIKDDPLKYISLGGKDFLVEKQDELNIDFANLYNFFVKNNIAKPFIFK